MNTIFREFKGSMERIRNNFYFSFLALNFLNQRPFKFDILLDVEIKENFLSAKSANNFDTDGVQEYGNSIRRYFLNDIVMAYERYSMLMYVSHDNRKSRIDPAVINNRNLGAKSFEDLGEIYSDDDKKFFEQLRRLRNSIVHFNGVYCATNELNYNFDGENYFSKGNEGQSITIKFDTILWIYTKIIEIVEKGNKNYFLFYR